MTTAANLHLVTAKHRDPLSVVRGPVSKDAAHCKTMCQTCGLRELCLPSGLSPVEMEQLNGIVSRKRTLKRGNHLYRAGSDLHSLYAVRTGFLKSCVLHEDGREQVTGFHMMGELVGMDAIGSGKHISDTLALEDSEICDIPYTELERLSREMPALQRHFHRIMSREIARDYGVMMLLGSMHAEERLATFLLNLSKRFAARGYSASSLVLRMTREEIGSYLGLKLETVSRAFSHFQNAGLISVQNKNIEIKDPAGMHAMIGQGAAR
jgi:CRP/FNR family transcriptional regulator